MSLGIFEKIYVNPPYGYDKLRKTSIKNWIARCYNAYLNGSEILLLIPVATNTSHWKEYIYKKANSICFLYDTRLKFLENGVLSKKGAPMSCCIVYYGNNYNRFYNIFNSFGEVIRL